VQVIELGADAFVLVGDAYQSNSTVFVNGDDCLLVDAMGSAADAEALRAFIEVELNKRVRFILCTHYFSDHLAGLRLFPEATIIAHKDYVHTFASERFRSEEEAAHFVEPQMQLSGGMRLKWGRHTLDIFHNPGHTMSTLGIEVPEADLLMAGDTVVGNIVYLAYTVPELMEEALGRLRRRERGRLLASHMGPRDRACVDHAGVYLRRLGERVREARRTGRGEGAILEIGLEDCLDEGLGGTNFERMFHRRNLESAIERGLFPSPDACRTATEDAETV
jgi:glyoxylase-like metal-dependent hydrolase (beta-lactamase superfamily II)